MSFVMNREKPSTAKDGEHILSEKESIHAFNIPIIYVQFNEN